MYYYPHFTKSKTETQSLNDPSIFMCLVRDTAGIPGLPALHHCVVNQVHQERVLQGQVWGCHGVPTVGSSQL